MYNCNNNKKWILLQIFLNHLILRQKNNMEGVKCVRYQVDAIDLCMRMILYGQQYLKSRFLFLISTRSLRFFL